MPTSTRAELLAATWLETEAACLTASLPGAIVMAIGHLKRRRRGGVALPVAHVVDFGPPATALIAAAGASARLVGSVGGLAEDDLTEACRQSDVALCVIAPGAAEIITPATFSWIARQAGAATLLVIDAADRAMGMGSAGFDLTVTRTANGLGVIGGRGDAIGALRRSVWAAVAAAAKAAVEQALPWLEAQADAAVRAGQPPDPISGQTLRPDVLFTAHPDGTLTPAGPQQG